MYDVEAVYMYPDQEGHGEAFPRGHKSSEFLDDIKLMQYTGLKDKSFNEVEIYEGDLFGKSDSDGVEVFGEVYFDTDFAGFCVSYPSGGWTTLGEHLLEKQNHREVVGNIYENPELLQKGEG
jgi:uncharacterized phage protein (TIGR01671 family)